MSSALIDKKTDDLGQSNFSAWRQIYQRSLRESPYCERLAFKVTCCIELAAEWKALATMHWDALCENSLDDVSSVLEQLQPLLDMSQRIFRLTQAEIDHPESRECQPPHLDAFESARESLCQTMEFYKQWPVENPEGIEAIQAAIESGETRPAVEWAHEISDCR